MKITGHSILLNYLTINHLKDLPQPKTQLNKH